MSIYWISIAAIFLCGLVIATIKRNKKPRNYPSGPISLPIVGNIFQAGFDPHLSFIEIGKKYGDIFSFEFGSFRCVVINDLKLIRQCLAQSAFSGRPNLPVLIDRCGGPNSKNLYGIGMTDGPRWVEQRRLAVKNLKVFGFGKTSMESIIHEEVTELLDLFRADAGKLISTKGRFNAASLNCLLRIMMGKRLPQSDPQLQTIIRAIEMGFSSSAILCMFFPTLTKMFPKLTGYAKLSGVTKPVDDFIHEALQDHRKTIIHGQPRDVLDALLDEVAFTTDLSSPFYKEEGDISVIKTLADLFIGGAETTSTVLEWICLQLALHSEYQEKMYDEINDAVESSSLPRLSDRVNMPYTECFLMESQRFSSILPLAVPHNMMQDTDFAGYLIPKDTVILSNLFAVHYSKEIWGDPEIFRPERFLLSDRTPNRSHEALIPFSTGKRICPGEKLAKDEIFLFTATYSLLIYTNLFIYTIFFSFIHYYAVSLIQKFRISTNSKGQPPKTKGAAGMTLTPPRHLLIFHERL